MRTSSWTSCPSAYNLVNIPVRPLAATAAFQSSSANIICCPRIELSGFSLGLSEYFIFSAPSHLATRLLLLDRFRRHATCSRGVLRESAAQLKPCCCEPRKTGYRSPAPVCPRSSLFFFSKVRVPLLFKHHAIFGGEVRAIKFN